VTSSNVAVKGGRLPLLTSGPEKVFSKTGFPADNVLGGSEGHYRGLIRGPGIADRKKLLYDTRSIEVAKLTVCHYGLACHSHHTRPVVEKLFLPYVEVKI
jgi:hypothetical protein